MIFPFFRKTIVKSDYERTVRRVRTGYEHTSIHRYRTYYLRTFALNFFYFVSLLDDRTYVRTLHFFAVTLHTSFLL